MLANGSTASESLSGSDGGATLALGCEAVRVAGKSGISQARTRLGEALLRQLYERVRDALCAGAPIWQEPRMTQRTAIAQIAKTIGRELQDSARPSESAWAAGAMLADAGATKEIVTCLFIEAHRKRPSDRLINGCAFMLERALDTLRLRANGGDVGAGRAIEEVRQGIEQALVKDGATIEVLIMIARAFAQAELDPGEALQEAVVSAMDAQSAALPPGQEPADIGDQFDDLAASLGNDPFTIYAEFAAMGAAFPAEHRAAMASALAMSNRAAVREAVLGFACEANPTTSAAALMALAQPPRGCPVSSTMVDRLVRMRPWLAEARRANLDAAIRGLRPKATTPEPVPRPEIRSVMASLCDGAGAQSLFALVKRGRRFALAAVLVKMENGVADAWVTDDMSKAEAEALIGEIVAGSETTEISIGLLERRLADALASNVARDAPPPFGLLQVAEAIGLGLLHPEAISPETLVQELLADLPAERTGTVAATAAHRASVKWEQEFRTLKSWFEAGEAVETLLRPIRTRKQRIEAVLTRLLPGRRNFWAERCAWTAAVLKESAEDDETWIDFALVARDLADGCALEAMPLAAQIAAATVEAFVHR